MSKDATVTDHRLNGVPFQAANSWRDQAITPALIVLHDTAGALRPRSSVEWFLSPECPNSAHLVVERDGSVTQLVPFNKVAFHAGQSTWHGRANCNAFSIGIEIVNPGRLAKVGSSAKAAFGAAWPLAEVEPRTTKEHGAGYWMPYTPAQIEAVTAICKALAATYPIEDITTHWFISPGRKIDTNPLFPLAEVKAAAFATEAPVSVPVTAAAEPTVVRAGAVTAADLAKDGSRSVGWLTWILRFFGLGSVATGSFTLADITGAFKGTTTALKGLAADNAGTLLCLGVLVGVAVTMAAFMARQRIVDAAREGRYQPQQK